MIYINNEEEIIRNVFDIEEDKVNITANKLNIDCITSNQDKFNLDSEGNLTVNSIITNTSTGNSNNSLDSGAVVDLIYPIGSIYLTLNESSPELLFGGSWEKITDKFLIGAGSTYSLNSTGGATTHTHTSAAHTHTSVSHNHALSDTGWADLDLSDVYVNYKEMSSGASYVQNYRKPVSGTLASYSSTRNYGTALGGYTNSTTPAATGSTTPGNTGSSSLLPPYLGVYIWKRTA